MISMPRGKRVAAAVSGGVDSLCALLLLKKSGWDVFALHGQFTDREAFDTQKLAKICTALGLELHHFDLRRVFAEKVAGPFAESFLNGQTPNPCAICNREIKFAALLEEARRLGAEFFATGHYARAFQHPLYGRQVLGPAKDRKKDQTYFLSLLPSRILGRLLFPLADLDKDECRRIVASAGLEPPNARESQDVCFLENGERHADFVGAWARENSRPLSTPGPIYILEKDRSGKTRKREAGTHKGLWHYTIGQRKGLGIAYSEPLYVLAREAESNSLLLAPRSLLLLKACLVGKPNFFVDMEAWPDRPYSRLRYRQKSARATASVRGDKIFLNFEEPQFPGAEGQVATVEDEDGAILAAGLIERMYFQSWD